MIKPEHFKLLCSFDLFEPVWNKQTQRMFPEIKTHKE